MVKNSNSFKYSRSLLCCVIIFIKFLLMYINKIFMCWVLLEVDLFFIMVLMYKNLSFNNFMDSPYNETLMWYFLMQVLGGMGMIMGGMINKFNIILMSIFIKVGIFPLYYWVPFIYNSLSWGDIFIVGMMSKMGLINVLMKFLSEVNMSFFVFVILVTYFFSALGIFNKMYNIKVMMGWSSINNLCLMLYVMSLDMYLGSWYLMLYLFFFYLFCYYSKYLNISDIKSILLGKIKNLYLMIYLSLLLILIGLPSFIMFWLKVNMIAMVWKTLFFVSYMTLFSLSIFLQILIYMKVFSVVMYKFMKLKKVYYIMKNKMMILIIILLLMLMLPLLV